MLKLKIIRNYMLLRNLCAYFIIIAYVLGKSFTKKIIFHHTIDIGPIVYFNNVTYEFEN